MFNVTVPAQTNNPFYELQQRIIKLASGRDAAPSQPGQLVLSQGRLVGVTLSGAFSLKNELVLRMRCLDSYGFENKTNKDGFHSVAGIFDEQRGNGVFFKNQHRLKHICPGWEAFTFLFDELIISPGLHAPTMLLKVFGSTKSINPKEQDNMDAFNELTRRIALLKDGKSPGSILEEDPALKSQLKITEETVGRVVQAGQGIDGILLHDVLELQKEFTRLTKQFGKAKLPEILTSLIAGNYLAEFKVSPLFSLLAANKSSDKALYKEMRSFMARFPSDKRLVEYRILDGGESSSDPVMREFEAFMSHHSYEDLVQALALINKWPDLMVGQTLADMVSLPKKIRRLQNLLPKCTIEELVEKAPRLLEDYLDRESYSEALISARTMRDADANSGNYMLRISRDGATNQLEKFNLVVIDGDEAGAHEFTKNGKKGSEFTHAPGLKCVLFHLPMLHEKVPAKVQEKFKQAPALAVFEWLSQVYQLNQDWQRLVDAGEITESDYIEEKTRNGVIKSLDFPIEVFPGFIDEVYDDLSKLKDIFNSSAPLTNHSVFSRLSPILSDLNDRISKKFPEPLEACAAFFHCTVEDELADVLDSKSITTPEGKVSYREALRGCNHKPSDFENRTESIEVATQRLINKLDLLQRNPEDTEAWKLLRFIAQKFPFINYLHYAPLDRPHWERARIWWSKAVKANDTAVMELLLKTGALQQAEMQTCLFRAVRDGDSATLELFLKVGTDVNSVDEALRTVLHLAVRHVDKSLLLCKILLRHPSTNLYAFDQSGYPAFFHIDLTNNRALFELFIAHGIDLETRAQEPQKRTLVDRAIERDRPGEFLYLIEKGAGSTADPQKILQFIRKYSRDSQWRTKMHLALMTLKERNGLIAWEFDKEVLFTKDGPGMDITGLHTGPVRLKQEVVANLHESSKGDNATGNHAVKFASYKCRVFQDIFPDVMIEHESEVCLKIFPEAPLVQKAVELFSRLLFGESITALSELFRFPDGSPVLISKRVQGNDLPDVFKSHEEFSQLQNNLDDRTVSMLIVLHMLLNIEDGKPDNFNMFVKKIKDQISYLLKGFDDDHAFGPALTRNENGERELSVKSIVFCLKHMKRPLHPDVVRTIVNTNPLELLEKFFTQIKEWEKQCNAESETDKGLFKPKQRERLLQNGKNSVIFTAPFLEGTGRELFENLTNLQQNLRSDPTQIAMDVVVANNPVVGIPYQEAHKKSDNPKVIFDQVCGTQYTKLLNERYGTKVSHKQRLESAGAPAAAFVRSARENAENSAVTALAEVKEAAKEQQDVQYWKAKVLAGEPGPRLHRTWQRIMDDTAFAELNAEEQGHLLRHLIKGRIEVAKLDLHNCLDLGASQIKLLLQNQPNLKELDLSGCEQLSQEDLEEIFQILEKHCQVLTKLKLQRLPQLKSFCQSDSKNLVVKVFQKLKEKPAQKPYHFPQLKCLWLDDCFNLETIKLDAPYLEWLNINNLPALSSLEMGGQQLRLTLLHLTGTPNLPVETVVQLMVRSPKLLNNMHVKTDYPLPLPTLAWFCNNYDGRVWSEKNLSAFIENGELNLNGIPVQNEDFEELVQQAKRQEKPLTRLNLESCPALNGRNLRVALTELLDLDEIVYTDYSKSLSQETQVVDLPESYRTLRVGANGEVFCGSQSDKNNVVQLDLASGKPGFVMRGHSSPISAMAIADNGSLITGDVGGIKLWEPFIANSENNSSKKAMGEFKGHSGAITALLARKNILVSASQDKTLRFWDMQQGSLLKTQNLSKDVIKTLESWQEDRFISGSKNGVLQEWSLDGTCLGTIQDGSKSAHGSDINVIKRLSNELLATGGSDGLIKIWRCKVINGKNTWDCIKRIKAHNAPVLSLEVLAEEQLIVSTSMDKMVKCWNVTTGACTHTLSGHKDYVNSVALLPDGKIVTVSDDKNLRIWHFSRASLSLVAINQARSQIVIKRSQNRLMVTFDNADPGVKLLRDTIIQVVNLAMQRNGEVRNEWYNNTLVFTSQNEPACALVESLLIAIQKRIEQKRIEGDVPSLISQPAEDTRRSHWTPSLGRSQSGSSSRSSAGQTNSGPSTPRVTPKLAHSFSIGHTRQATASVPPSLPLANGPTNESLARTDSSSSGDEPSSTGSSSSTNSPEWKSTPVRGARNEMEFFTPRSSSSQSSSSGSSPPESDDVLHVTSLPVLPAVPLGSPIISTANPALWAGGNGLPPPPDSNPRNQTYNGETRSLPPPPPARASKFTAQPGSTSAALPSVAQVRLFNSTQSVPGMPVNLPKPPDGIKTPSPNIPINRSPLASGAPMFSPAVSVPTLTPAPTNGASHARAPFTRAGSNGPTSSVGKSNGTRVTVGSSRPQQTAAEILPGIDGSVLGDTKSTYQKSH